MKYYDPHHNRLIYIKESATPNFWDRHWASPPLQGGVGGGIKKNRLPNLRHDITRKKFDMLVVPNTKKYLSGGSRVLEGGCGTGVHVYNLNRHGFKCTGIDIAPETVTAVKAAVPEMDVRLGDVFALPFPNNSFDGYWSIGVIEHFWDGYDGIAREMHRVLRPGGYLFLTFPYMSPLRRLKARLNLYPPSLEGRGLGGGWQGETPLPNPLSGADASYARLASGLDPRGEREPKDFYQFALDHKQVTEEFGKHDFELVEALPFDGFNGLKNEVSSLEFVLNHIARGKSKITKAAKLAIYKTCQGFTGHSVLLVLQKK